MLCFLHALYFSSLMHPSRSLSFALPSSLLPSVLLTKLFPLLHTSTRFGRVCEHKWARCVFFFLFINKWLAVVPAVLLPLHHSEFIRRALWKSTQPGGGAVNLPRFLSDPLHFNCKYCTRLSVPLENPPKRADIHAHAHTRTRTHKRMRKHKLCLNLLSGGKHFQSFSSSPSVLKIFKPWTAGSGVDPAEPNRIGIEMILITVWLFGMDQCV